MRALDRDALFCDFAEYYHVIGFEDLPIRVAAVLAVGLPDKSRIKRRLADVNTDLDTMLLAGILDGVRVIAWQRTKDGEKNRNRPESILQKLTEKEKEKETVVFDSAEAFWEKRKRIMEAHKNGRRN